MTGSERFSVVSPLPPHGEWRRTLALDRSAGGPHVLVLAFVPHALLEDPARLAALVRNVEAAGRLVHPAAVPVLGTETVGDALAVVEAYRSGPTLREILDAGGRLPADVAARVVADVAGALARAHTIDAGEGRTLAHGAVTPTRILVGTDGAALLGGFGTGPESSPADDVRALAAVAYECLEGEPPPRSPAAPAAGGVAPELAGAIARALGAAPGPVPSAAALAAAAGAAEGAASHAAVAVYADAMLPPAEGSRGALSAALAAALGVAPEQEVTPEDIVEPTEPGVRAPPRRAAAPAARLQTELRAPAEVTPPAEARPAAQGRLLAELRLPPEPTPEPLPRPPATRPGVDPAGVFPAPAPASASRWRGSLWVAFVCGALGFAAGFAAARLATPPSASSASAPAERVGGPAAIPAAPAPPAASPTPAAVAGEAGARKAARLADAPAPKRSGKAARPQRPPAPSAAPAAPAGRGILSVSAPDEAEVFLDGRRIGKGNVKVEIDAGPHRIEARMGEARVGERFSLEPGETWTYDVTPTQ